MSEDKKRDKKSDEARRRFGRFWSTFAIVVIICCLVWKIILWNCRSPDEQLAAIEASLAIPESENAGVTYRKLAEDYLPLPTDPPVVNKQILSLTREESWHSSDYPKLAAWLDERQDLISKLLGISRMKKCRLPIPLDRQKMSHFTNPVRQMHGWTSLLVRSGNMDTGEGRIDAAIEKYACILRMGSHLCQQPVSSYYNNGIVTESLALQCLEKLITQTELSDKQLAAIEAAMLPPRNKWKQDSKIMVKVQRLLQNKERRRFRIIDWRRYWEYWKVINKSDDYSLNAAHRSHLNTLANRRRIYVLIALQHYKTGNWPQSLDRIKPPPSKEILIDPVNNKLFIYELKGENFTLSDRGKD
jgi:hypothetical protein